jgi:hypothetical protein
MEVSSSSTLAAASFCMAGRYVRIRVERQPGRGVPQIVEANVGQPCLQQETIEVFDDGEWLR